MPLALAQTMHLSPKIPYLVYKALSTSLTPSIPISSSLLLCSSCNGLSDPLTHLCACSVPSNSWQPHGLQPARLLCPQDSLGKNTGMGCHFLLQGIFLTQRSNWCLLHLLHCQVDSLPLESPRKPSITPCSHPIRN